MEEVEEEEEEEEGFEEVCLSEDEDWEKVGREEDGSTGRSAMDEGRSRRNAVAGRLPLVGSPVRHCTFAKCSLICPYSCPLYPRSRVR